MDGVEKFDRILKKSAIQTLIDQFVKLYVIKEILTDCLKYQINIFNRILQY